MLVEVRCDKFKDAGIVRPPICFHSGLNVVLGTSKGTNSIGKSTFLLILDFVFGGNDYATTIRDAANHVGEHVIQYVFRFGTESFFFARGTATYETVERCNADFKPCESWTIAKYREFLAEQYLATESGLSFRELVSRFIRVYHRENHNELRPLDANPRAKGEEAIVFLLKAFGLFQVLKEAKHRATEAKNSLKALRNGVKFGHILSVSTAKEEKELNAKLGELMRLRDSSCRAVDLQGKTTEEAMRIVGIKRDLQVSRARKSRLEEKLGRLESQGTVEMLRFVDDFREVERLFPGISLKKLEEVESFHRRITDILGREITEEIEATKSEYSSTVKTVGALEAALAMQPEFYDIPKRILEQYVEYDSEIKTIERRLEKRREETQLKQDSRSLLNRYNDKCTDTLVSVQSDLNGKMSELDALIYGGVKRPPVIQLFPKKYDFRTLDDEGTGTAFKSTIVLALSIMSLTKLPFLVHDSLMFKNIGDDPLSKLIQLYQQQAPKQVFIAFDKADSYDQETDKTLERLCVLHLSDNEHALFGRSWSKIQS